MALATATISGYFYLPDGVTPRPLHVSVKAETTQNTLKSTAESSILSGVYDAESDGTGFLSIELPLLAALQPEGARWRATFRPIYADTAPNPPSVVFDLAGDTTWDALVDVSGVPVTEAVLTQFQLIRDETVAASQAAQAVGTTNDTIIAGRLDATGSATAKAAAASTGRRVAAFPFENFIGGSPMPNDGTTDAEPLIQAALVSLQAMALASTAFDTRVYVLDLPAGTFRTNQNLMRNMRSSIGEGVTRIGVRGVGRNATIIAPHGNAGGFSPFASGATPDKLAAYSCHFEGFTIDLENATHPDPTGASFKGFQGRGWKDCRFADIMVANSPATAIGTDFPVNCVFDDVHVQTTGSGAAGTVDANGAVDPANPITAAKSTSGFGIGLGLRADESATFINCTATDCYRSGFFFEAFEDDLGNDERTAIITMIGCKSFGNRVGLCDVGSSGVVATNCDFNDNSIVGVFGAISLGTQLVASLDVTLENCRINSNGVGIYATGDFVLNRNYTTLRPVLGGYRVINCRIEDNVAEGILAERFESIEAGGLTVQGNHFRRNGKGGVRLVRSNKGLRDLVIDGNYFDGNTGAGLYLLTAMNAPKITGNTFVNASGGTAQTHGLVLHPSEPVTVPQIQGNTFRRMTTPMAYVSRLDQSLIKDNRVVDASADPETPAWLYREAFYGGSGTTFPASGDGWAKSTAGSQVAWTRGGLGISPTGGAGSRSYIYRDLAAAGAYVEATISTAIGSATATQPLGVMLHLQGPTSRTAVVAGVNGASASFGTSGFYSVWKMIGGAATKLWESTVPQTERHTIGLARASGSTMTHVFIDGVLVNSIDVTDVPGAATLGGVIGETASGSSRNIAEFRAGLYVAP